MPSEPSEKKTVRLSLETLEDCRNFAKRLAGRIQSHGTSILPLAIGLTGTLGAGKTQWTTFFSHALGAPSESTSSPTYVLIHRYDSEPVIYHVDAYRVQDEDEFLELGIEELFESNGITIVEWADRFPNLMPDGTLWIRFELDEFDPQRRWVSLDGAKLPMLTAGWL
ncbi:MAG: tRNA (adenosine(37)-N6)-threonylcarbamoyltransferase complex ATPase subunit type 1 TsaE [Pirellula sp.]|nr:tRNA (adenosine(37)-N6)-threonylcarbamoyltransferase complex ATPase subunit type 1 TsaE [Pirellula sp.]